MEGRPRGSARRRVAHEIEFSPEIEGGGIR
jgi:hypothetical protein